MSRVLGAEQAAGSWEDQLLAQYHQHMTRLPLGLPATRYRQAGARRLLQRLAGRDWHSPDIAPDLCHLDRYESGFVTFLLLFGYLRPGYDYLFSRKFTGMVREAPFSPLGDAVEAVARCGRALGFGKRHIEAFIPLVVLRLLIQTGKPLQRITTQDLEAFRQAAARYAATGGQPQQRHYTISLHAVENILYYLGVLNRPAVHRSARRTPWAERLAGLPQAGFRRTMTAYLEKLSTTHRYSTVLGYCRSFRLLARFLAGHAPEVSEVSELDRKRHIEPWLLWNAQRVRTVQGGQTRPIGQEDKKTAVVDVRCFLDQIAEWGWPESPPHRLLFNGDIPKLDYALPRYIPQEQEWRIMAAVRTLDDPLQQYALLILRATGLRIGELVDLELDCVHHVPGKGAWLKVPLGKLHTERMVPLDDDTLGLFDAVAQLRGSQKPLPHPLTGAPTEFLFVRRGKRVSREFIRDGLAKAVKRAGLVDQDGNPLRITPHQLRHTYATSLVNAGVSLQVLMHLLGHVTMEMSLRYGHLFDSTVRTQYDQALEKVKQRYTTEAFTLQAVASEASGGEAASSDTGWIENHQLKTRLAHGYCLRPLSQQACPYANICEQCPSFSPLPKSRATIEQQLHDARLLAKDAGARGWDSEVHRHRALVSRLESLLATLPETRKERRRCKNTN